MMINGFLQAPQAGSPQRFRGIGHSPKLTMSGPVEQWTLDSALWVRESSLVSALSDALPQLTWVPGHLNLADSIPVVLEADDGLWLADVGAVVRPQIDCLMAGDAYTAPSESFAHLWFRLQPGL